MLGNERAGLSGGRPAVAFLPPIALAKEQGQFSGDTSAEGPYGFMRDGRHFPYVIQRLSNATGPALANPPSRPATLRFAVSPGLKQAWLTR